jgi:tetratricopeptide (TPR) repeat protein
MNPARWQAIGELFDEAIALPAGERTTWIEQMAGADLELRAEVVSLLESHNAADGDFVQQEIRDAVVLFHGLSGKPLLDTKVGAYRLVRELGSGGMGIVFLAERDDDQYMAQVAVKLIRPGMDTEFIVSRFRRERQTLARLVHPNIARLLDGGTTENGLPYFVMEYVEGVSLKEHVREDGVTVRGRIELFLQICSAVDYAHRNFVIHRDVKPGNIVIDRQGQPKLLDFGICKLLQNDAAGPEETRVQLLTTNYASPEQIGGEALTLLTDVYSLGVVFYELMCGALPRASDAVVAGRGAFGEKRTLLPSQVASDATTARWLRGDLDTIAMRALECEPQDRYQSVAHFSDDIRRYLEHEPILAKAPTAMYRGRKFVLRHAALVAAAASVLVALSAGLGVSIKQTRTADRRLRQVQTLAGKLVFDVHDAIKDLPGSTPARSLVIRTGTDALELVADAVRGDAKAETDLAKSYRRLGDVQGGANEGNLGDTQAATQSYRKALTLLNMGISRRGDLPEAQTERLLVYERLVRMESATGHTDDALKTVREGIGLGNDALRGRDNRFKASLADLYLDSALAKRALRDREGSLQDAQESLRLNREIQASDPGSATVMQSLATTYAAIGMAESWLGRLAEAKGHYSEGVAEMEKLVAANPRSVARRRELMLAYGHVADLAGNPGLNNLGDRAGALAGYRRAMQIGRELHEADPANQRAATDYAIALSRTESVMDETRPAARMEVQQESLRVLAEASRVSPQSTALKVYQALEFEHLGDSLLAQGKLGPARGAYLNAIGPAEQMKRLGDTSALLFYIASNERLAEIEIRSGRREEALRYAQAGLHGMPQAALTVAQRLIVPRTCAAMGRTYAKLAQSDLRAPSDREQAVRWLKQSLAAWQSVQEEPAFGSPHRQEMQAVSDLLASLSRG